MNTNRDEQFSSTGELRFLILEDSDLDAHLVMEEIGSAGIRFKHPSCLGRSCI